MRRALGLVLALIMAPAGAQTPVFISQYVWTGTQDGFGGFSGLEIQAGGQEFTTISDHGKILTGTFARKNGVITGVNIRQFVPLLDTHGKPVRKYNIDAEGLAIDSGGRIYVSFEANHRVWRYNDPTSAATRLKKHPDFKKMINNSSLESLAIGQNATLFTMPERSGDPARAFPVYRYRGKSWDQPFAVPRRDRFLPVGSDIGPDGKFYLLERDFIWYYGFATRIRRFDLTEAGLTNEETLLETPFGTYDNLEGIATWRDAQGRTRLTMISDDNFSMFQKTEFVEYALPPPAQ